MGGKLTQAPATPELVERLRESAQAFRNYPIFTADGDPVRLTVQSDECQEAAAALEAQRARIAELEAERRSVIANIPMDYLKAHDAAGATAPTVSLDLVGAMRSYAEARWRIIDRCKKAEALADRYEKALRFYANAVVASQHPDRLGACDDGWAARQALSSQGRREGGEDGLPELPGVNAVPLPASPDGLQTADEHRYAKLGRACEAHGLGWFDEDGEMRFQPPADMIAEQARREAREAL